MKRSGLIALVTMILAFGLASFIMAATDIATHDIQITINEIALMRVLTNAQIAFSVGSPATEGDEPVITGTPNNTKYLQYTSIVNASDRRTITAETSEDIPSGLILKLTASTPSTGKGDKGSSSGEKTLSSSAQTIISDIGSCYTGIGDSSGSNLSYTLEIDDDNIGNLTEDDDIIVTVTFTLTDDE